jgi:hypothetical protein
MRPLAEQSSSKQLFIKKYQNFAVGARDTMVAR